MTPETYIFVKRSIKTLLAINLDGYKSEQMQRRLNAWLARSGRASWPDYFRYARETPTELTRLRNYLTINVSSFFRDPERWADLYKHLQHELQHRPGPLRLWSAGCSIGLEAYSLAILLHQLAPARRHLLLATDLDQGALAIARARGPFTEQDVQNITPMQRQAYFENQDGQFFVTPQLARLVFFKEHNLLEDPFESNFDLIICRNVVIYFTAAAKQQLYQKFYAALRTGGLLFVGGTEIIPADARSGFENYGLSFYRKQ